MSSEGSFSARIAAFFIRSHLTPLLIVVSIALGMFATATTPKEEEPTITIAMFDIAIAWPGHEAAEVDERIARPVAAWVRELSGVEHVLSASTDDGALLGVQFRQGVRREDAFTQLNERLGARRSLLPPDALSPTLTSRGIEDVPVITFSITSDSSTPQDLRRHAVAVARSLSQQGSVSSAEVVGGAQRAFRIDVDPAKLAAHRLDIETVNGAIRQAHLELPIGRFESGGTVSLVRAGSLIGSAPDLEGLPLAPSASGVIRLCDVAVVRDVVMEPTSYVAQGERANQRFLSDAVSIVIFKNTGANATELTERLRRWMAREGAQLLPSDAKVHVTRDAGETAQERVTTLFEHIGIATLVVVILIGLSLGRREALIVAIVIPTTLAVVPFVYQATGFTLNRITLAAMIFAIGILVDDAIVVVENVHRRFQEDGARASSDLRSLAADAVGEVANPTILATFTVVAALTPTAFVSGMIGQYVRPLPVGASVAMVFSLVIALTVTPYLSYRILRTESGAHETTPGWLHVYRKSLSWTLASPLRGIVVGIGAMALLFGALALLPTRAVLVKLLPGSDATDISVVVDLPAGTSLSRTHQQQKILAARLLEIPEVEAVQVYSGQPGPMTFQGVARRYMLRSEPHQGEIQIELVPRAERSRDSHTIAAEVRNLVQAQLEPVVGAVFTVAEPPPGPPVQAALVAEIYGPSEAARVETATHVRDAFRANTSLVDVDWTLKPSTPQTLLRTDVTSLSLHAVSGARLVTGQRSLFAGEALMALEIPGEPERVPVVVGVSDAKKSQPNDVLDLRTVSMRGAVVPLAEVAHIEQRPARAPLLRKDLVPVVFVTAEMHGAGAPAYAALDVTRALRRAGVQHDIQWVERVPDEARTTIRWAGEWTTTYELFRDLGLAFAVALAAIYVMLVAWYGSYVTPVVVMIPIPLALVGVVPAHLLAGTPMSGMAVIGLIALAGTMVRNSILLVDFSQENRKAGHSIVDAIVLASQARARPILLTAGTVIFGDGILFFDPLLKGLGLTMAAGALVSTLLTLAIVPIAYSVVETWMARRATPAQ